MKLTLTTIAPLQTDAVPTGGDTSPILILLIIGVALYAVDRWVVDLGQYLPSLGGGSSSGGMGIPFVSSNRLLIGALAIVLALVAVGPLGLPAGSSVPLIVALNLLGAYLVLRELGAYDPMLFVIIAATTVVIALSALGEPVIGALANSEVAPILTIGVLYLGYRAIKAWSKANQPPKVVLDDDEVDGGGR